MVPAADPKDPGSAPAHPLSSLCLLCRRRGARSPLGTRSRSRGTISPKVGAGPGSPHSRASRCPEPQFRQFPVLRAPVAVPLLSAPLGGSRSGARMGALGSPVPVQGPLPRRCRGGPASPRLGLAHSEKTPGRRVL